MRWLLVSTTIVLICSKAGLGETDVPDDTLADTDVGEDNSIIVVTNMTGYEKLSEVSRLVVQSNPVVRTGRSMLTINLENSRGKRISSMSFSPTSFIMSLFTLVFFLFSGDTGDFLSRGLVVAQILNG